MIALKMVTDKQIYINLNYSVLTLYAYMKKSKILVLCLIIPIFSALSGCLFCLTPPIRHFKNIFYDYMMKMGVGENISDTIRIIVVDDQSVQRGDKWPWPWINHAGVLNFLSRTNIAAAGVDIRFESYESQKEGLEALKYCTSLTGRTILPYYFRMKQDDKGIYYRDYIKEESDGTLDKYRLNIVNDDFVNKIPEAESYQLPVAELRDCGLLGFTNVPGESDGVVRKTPLFIKYSGNVYPSFSLVLLCRFLNKGISDIKIEKGVVSIFGTDIKIPVDKCGNLRINFRGGLKEFKGDPAIQVLNSDKLMSEGKIPVVPLSDYSGKMVIYGVGMTGGYDIGLIPISPEKLPLLLIHANALNTVLLKDYIKEPPFVWRLLIVLLLSAAIGFIQLSYKSWFYVTCSVVFIAGFILAAFWFFINHNLYMDIVTPYTAMSICFGSAVIYKYVVESKDKKYVKKILGRYISNNIMEMLLRDPSKLNLHGERKDITVLFADIKGFTPYCEKKAPEEVVPVLNEYLDRMTRVILSHDGTFDKYVGDEIMAFWNAPVEQKGHAKLAVLAALDMLEELKALQGEFVEKGIEPIDIGIGINSGLMMVGNMGSSQFYDYTVVGDNVNLASRVQALTREYPYRVIVTEATYNCVKDDFETDFLGEVSVKGKDRKVKVYGVKGKRID